MPQIGWYEILIVVVLAILIVGPKDFPIMLKKMGSWIGSMKNYFNDIQKDVSDIGNDTDDEVSIQKELNEVFEDKKKDE